MTTHEPKESGYEQIGLMREGVSEIIELAGVALEQPGERRADTELPEGFEYTEEKETAIRRIASEKLGIGIDHDITPEIAGLHLQGLMVIEGGQSHKMLAELSVALNGDFSGPIILSATEHRVIRQTGDDPKIRERANTAALLGLAEDEVGSTEYDVAIQVATIVPGFEAVAERTELAEGVVLIGSVAGREIYAYSIPREYYNDESGVQRYRQPTPADQATYLRDVTQSPDVALVTSSTYFSSRVIAGKGSYKVAAYCPATLAQVRGQDSSSAKSELHQILSETAKIDNMLN